MAIFKVIKKKKTSIAGYAYQVRVWSFLRDIEKIGYYSIKIQQGFFGEGLSRMVPRFVCKSINGGRARATQAAALECVKYSATVIEIEDAGVKGAIEQEREGLNCPPAGP